MNTIEKLYQLSDDDCESIYHFVNDDYSVEIRQFESLRWLHIDGVSIQSVINIDEPSTILNPVNLFMLCGMIFSERIKKVLNIGLGGASIERFLQSEYSELEIHSIESNEHIIHLAREFFFLPYEHPVYNLSAIEFLNHAETQYDIIFCDIFDNEQHPACLYESAFYEMIADKLTHKGVFICNLLSKDEKDLIRILKIMRCHLPFTCLLKIENHDNVIIYSRRSELSSNDHSLIDEQFTQFMLKHSIASLPFNWELNHLPVKK